VSDAYPSVRQEGYGKVGPSFRWDDGIETCPKSVLPLFCRHSSASWNPLPVSDAYPSVHQEGNGKMGPSFRWDDGIEACPKSVLPLFCCHSSESWNPLPVSGAHPSVRQEGNGKMGPSFRWDDGRTYPNRCRHHLAVIPAKAGIHCPSVVRILPYDRKATARWVPAFAGTTGGRIRTGAITALPSFQRKLESIARQ
jgi:hypothetical protein